MTGDTMTPNGFLLARIAEDEEMAQAVVADMPRWDEPDWEASSLEVGGSLPGPQFTARMSPARVLAECAAKRRIVALHKRTAYLPGDDPDDGCIICGGWPCDTLRALALPYADHPDFPAALTADVNVR